MTGCDASSSTGVSLSNDVGGGRWAITYANGRRYFHKLILRSCGGWNFYGGWNLMASAVTGLSVAGEDSAAGGSASGAMA